jgi:hypothetical protein
VQRHSSDASIPKSKAYAIAHNSSFIFITPPVVGKQYASIATNQSPVTGKQLSFLAAASHLYVVIQSSMYGRERERTGNPSGVTVPLGVTVSNNRCYNGKKNQIKL